MNLETIISEEFRFYTLNYALAQRKDVSDLNIDVVYKKWEHLKKIKDENKKRVFSKSY